MDGLILVHKPKGLTSHDIVIQIRKILDKKRVGHFGTLDPLATGLLLIAVGKATRLFPFYLRATKTYKGQIRLGYSTDTYDSDGEPLSRESKNYPDKKTLLENMKRFLGEIEQISPPYSAKKYKGKALYKLVRQQKEYQLKSSKVVVHYFRLTKFDPPHMDFEVKCSSGTYIRSIAHELGQSLGCGAHLNQLERIEISKFHISKSYTVEEIEKMSSLGQTKKFLHPIEVLLPEYPKIIVKDRAVFLVRNGCEFFPDSTPTALPSEEDANMKAEKKQDIFRIFDSRGRLLAFAIKKAEKNSLHPFLVFDTENKSR
jgi:tRNA pseudouridine55 synthase